MKGSSRREEFKEDADGEKDEETEEEEDEGSKEEEDEPRWN